MHLLAVGHLRPSPEADLFARYAARLRPKLTVTEIPEGRGAPAELRRRQAEALLAALPPSAIAVVLDQAGPQLTSEDFAARLQAWLASGRPVAFLIGGADGLTRAALNRADFVLSLGSLTWPHMLARAMLAEQLFRAQSILGGHPYHRAARPAET